jgi:hypothetical protein
MTEARSPLRIANCSGFYGDRVAAAREMVDGGPIDVLTGDWLAELTMLILSRGTDEDPDRGFAHTFVDQMGDVLADCLARRIRVVTNAGGLNPAGCAAAVARLAAQAGLSPTIAVVEGDNLLGRLDQLRADGHDFVNLDTGERLADVGAEPVTANAYFGAWGIVEALARGADIVITGRVTDASLVVGPAAWHFGWSRTDWDELAAAVVAGHILECGAQCTGGNYAFFEEIPGLERPGFPLAEIHADGSFVVTKHPGTGGLVSVGTITAQLLYEIQGLEYANPDAMVRMNSIRLDDDGPDRVRVHGVRGRPGPDTLKVAINYGGGYRNSMTFMLTGLDIEQKAALAERTLWSMIPGGRESFDQVDVNLRRTDRPDPATNDDALAELVITVMDRDRAKVGRAFSNKVIEMVLANYPGLFTTSPPTDGSRFGVYWPTSIPAEAVEHTVVMGAGTNLGAGEGVAVAPAAPKPPALAARTPPATAVGAHEPSATSVDSLLASSPETVLALLDNLGGRRLSAARDDPYRLWSELRVRPAPLGRVLGARSGDKGGNANIGVWARTDDAYDWMAWFLTLDRLRRLMPAETHGLEVERFELANLRAVNFVIKGLLGRGVAASTRTDPQAKGLGEYLRAKVVAVPETLLDNVG